MANMKSKGRWVLKKILGKRDSQESFKNENRNCSTNEAKEPTSVPTGNDDRWDKFESLLSRRMSRLEEASRRENATLNSSVDTESSSSISSLRATEPLVDTLDFSSKEKASECSQSVNSGATSAVEIRKPQDEDSLDQISDSSNSLITVSEDEDDGSVESLENCGRQLTCGTMLEELTPTWLECEEKIKNGAFADKPSLASRIMSGFLGLEQ